MTFTAFIVSTYMVTIVFFFNDTATTEIYTLSLHDALPISRSSASAAAEPSARHRAGREVSRSPPTSRAARSEEHTSELQSPCNLVCRLLLEKKKRHHNYLCLQLKSTQP